MRAEDEGVVIPSEFLLDELDGKVPSTPGTMTKRYRNVHVLYLFSHTVKDAASGSCLCRISVVPMSRDS